MLLTNKLIINREEVLVWKLVCYLKNFTVHTEHVGLTVASKVNSNQFVTQGRKRHYK